MKLKLAKILTLSCRASKIVLFVLLFILMVQCKKDNVYSTDGVTQAVISTDMGDITVKLYDATPRHRDNFIKLANEGFYDGLLFHRVIEDFIVQSGNPNSRNAAPGEVIEDRDCGYLLDHEILNGLKHKRGVLAAARWPDQINPEKKSSGSQFYLTVEETPFLDGEYTIYGEMIGGFDVLDAISKVEIDDYARPLSDVKITRVTIKQGIQ